MASYYNHAETSFVGTRNHNSGYGFAFPKLTTVEIMNCLTELGFPVTKDQLIHPEENKEVVKSLLEFLAEICLGINRDELTQPAFAGLNAINYPELHEESIPQLNSLRAIMKTMELCEINDFSVRDLMAPDAKRLNRQLSGIMNFAKFREERIMVLSELNATREELLDKLAQAREMNDKVNSRLALLRQHTQDEESMIRGLESDIGDLENSVANLQSQQSANDADIALLSEEHISLKEQISRAEEEHEDLKSVHRRLTSQIVTSPEKFRKQILEIGQQLQHEQKDTKTAEKKVRELSAWIVNIEEAQAEVNLALEAIQEVRNEVERQKTMIGELDTLKSKIGSLRAELSELSQNAQKQTRSVQRTDEKLAYLRKQSALRAAEAQEGMDNLHKQIVEAETFRLQVKTKGERLEGEAQRLQKELEAEVASQEQELGDIRATYQKLEKKVIAHLQDLQRMLEQHSPMPDKPTQSRYV